MTVSAIEVLCFEMTSMLFASKSPQSRRLRWHGDDCQSVPCNKNDRPGGQSMARKMDVGVSSLLRLPRVLLPGLPSSDRRGALLLQRGRWLRPGLGVLPWSCRPCGR